MCLGLDIAVLAGSKIVERLILITGDTDIIPAMKHGRKGGLQIVLAILPGTDSRKQYEHLLRHSDIIRHLQWPELPTQEQHSPTAAPVRPMAIANTTDAPGVIISAKVKRVMRSGEFGFVQSETGAEYHFHHTSIADGTKILDLISGTRVICQITKLPSDRKAGNVCDVRRITDISPE